MPTWYEFDIEIEDDAGDGVGGHVRGQVDMDIVGDKARKLAHYIFAAAKKEMFGTRGGQESLRSEGQLQFKNVSEAHTIGEWAKLGIKFTAPDIAEYVSASTFELTEAALDDAIESGEVEDLLPDYK